MRALSVTLAVLVGSFAVAQEKKTIDNPEFANWSKFKEGATTTLKMVSEFNGMKNTTTIVTKLVEAKADQLTMETTAEVEVMGKPFKAPAQKREVKKTLEVPANTPVPKDQKPEGTTEEGTETIKVGATDVKTKWYKYKSKTPAGEVSGQVWMSDEVPGQVVKMVSKSDKFSSTMELVEFKK